MVRRWQVPPDESGTMSREALISALIDASALLDIAGGTLSVVVGRQPTNLPGEMVMTGAVLEWRDRTDAKPQPEAPSTVHTGEVVEVRGPERTLVVDEPAEPEAGFKYEPEAATDDNPDGFDHDKLKAEDIEEPEPVR
jgi:hypothetical protein